MPIAGTMEISKYLLGNFHWLLFPPVFMQNTRHLATASFKLVVYPYFPILAFHSSLFSQKCFSLHADGGKVLQWRKHFMNTEVSSVAASFQMAQNPGH